MTSYREHCKNLGSITKDLDYKYDQKAETYMFGWTSKKEYLEWRINWRKAYKEISKKIRELKNQRKEFKYEYRPKGNNTARRRTIIGKNANYDYSAGWYIGLYRSKAKELMQVRTASKIEAGRQRQLRLKEAA